MHKIAFVNTNLITCGGIITCYEYVTRLKQLGYEADMYAEEGNDALALFYHCKHRPLSDLGSFDDGDHIISVRWEQNEMLKAFRGKKYQFVQGDDLVLLGETEKEKCTNARNDTDFKLIGVSKYVLDRWGRGDVIPNGINEQFFNRLDIVRDIDFLIEGNNEPNKNIMEAIQIAKDLSIGNTKIVWIGRETYSVPGVENVSNVPFEKMPEYYQRSKNFIKLSKSEGFCLPILEAFASGCTVYTRDMGGNDFCVYEGENQNCYHVDRPKNIAPNIVSNAKKKAEEYRWEKSIDKLLLCLKS